MGDRALIQFTNGGDEVSPVIYTHHEGHAVANHLNNLFERMGDGIADVSYASARMVGILHEATPGSLGLGMWHSTELEPSDSHGDAGCFVIDLTRKVVQVFGGYGLAAPLAADWTIIATVEKKRPRPYAHEIDAGLTGTDKLPAMCMVSALSAAEMGLEDEAIVITYGDSGYTRVRFLSLPEQIEQLDADRFNDERGITPAQIKAMVVGSMFGWDCKAADPETWA